MIKKREQRIKQVIIIGGFVQALGLARQAKQCGAKVILFNEDQYSITRYSKTVDEFVMFDSIDKLRYCLDKYVNINTLLVPTSDDYIDQIVSDYEYYASRFVVGLPSKQCVQLFGDKTNSYQFAEVNSIPHPKSWYVRELGGVILMLFAILSSSSHR